MNDRLRERLDSELADRDSSGTRRRLRVSDPREGLVNLASNDYLGLAGDARLSEAGRSAIDRFGCSSSASPLITGFGSAHQALLDTVKSWNNFDHGLIWNSGYVANQALMRLLPRRGDLVLADRLVHNSMISGVLASGARVARYRHCDLDHLETLLAKHSQSDRVLFVATESVFSMDGDCPDLKRIAELRAKYGFFWILDESHAVGWYGKNGCGLAEETEVADQVDALVGTLGKALGSMGAYTLFRDQRITDYLVNFSGEFIYSTYLAPSCAAVANKAVQCVAEAEDLRKRGRLLSKRIRKQLEDMKWEVAPGDSPVVSVKIGETIRTLELAAWLEAKGFLVGAVRPPTVPEGTSRLRVSLKAGLSDRSVDGLLEAFREIGKAR